MGVLQCFTCGRTFPVQDQVSFQNHVFKCQTRGGRGGAVRGGGRGGGGGGRKQLPAGVVEMRGATIEFEKGGKCVRSCNSCDEKVLRFPQSNMITAGGV